MNINYLDKLRIENQAKFNNEAKTISLYASDLTEIKGIGEKTKDLLISLGITDIEELSQGGSVKVNLMKAVGMNEKKIQVYIDKARIYMKNRRMRG